MTRSRIIIDTDPGHDDAIAIMLALASPEELEVVGLTVVAGNVPIKLTTDNTRKVCELSGRPDQAIYVGCSRPLVRRLVTAEHVHGESGLDGPDLPAPTMPVRPRHAVDFLVETLMAAPEGDITLCTLGPLTNIAMALSREPRIAPRVRRIVMMGGGVFEGGNVTPSAEFNIYVDPHAADIVFGSGVPITMIPLDCTHQAIATAPRVQKFRDMGTRVGTVTAQLLSFFATFDDNKYGGAGSRLHDPCVIAWLLRPDLFGGRDVNVTIEIASELTMGATVTDWWRVTDRPANAHVVNKIDSDGFFEFLTERLRRL